MRDCIAIGLVFYKNFLWIFNIACATLTWQAYLLFAIVLGNLWSFSLTRLLGYQELRENLPSRKVPCVSSFRSKKKLSLLLPTLHCSTQGVLSFGWCFIWEMFYYFGPRLGALVQCWRRTSYLLIWSKLHYTMNRSL